MEAVSRAGNLATKNNMNLVPKPDRSKVAGRFPIQMCEAHTKNKVAPHHTHRSRRS